MEVLNSTFGFTSAFPKAWDEIQLERIQVPSTEIYGLVFGTLVFFIFCKYTKRVYFHPLSRIPGPRLAAASHLFEAYHNIFGDGLWRQLVPLHKKYS